MIVDKYDESIVGRQKTKVRQKIAFSLKCFRRTIVLFC